jgi:hypothetical protein
MIIKNIDKNTSGLFGAPAGDKRTNPHTKSLNLNAALI